MSFQAAPSEAGTNGAAQGGTLVTRKEAIPVRTHVSGAFWKGACVAAPLGLTSWLVIAWLLS